MGMCCRAAVIAGVALGLAAPAHADPRSEIATRSKAAMASYDSMDYVAARQLLNQALAIAKQAKLDHEPIVARVYLELGIALLAGADQEAAKVALLSAVQIDPEITIDPAYRSPALVKLLAEAKAAAGETGGEGCEDVRGLEHTVLDRGTPGAAQPVEARIGGGLAPAKVVVMYRPEGAIDFIEARLARQAGCTYAGTIPAEAMRGSVVHYYLAAYDANSKVLAAKGSSGAPNHLGLGAVARAEDAEEPIVAVQPARGRKGAGVMVGVAGGTGFGYVTGRTEGNNEVQTCCIGSSLVVIAPEVGYHASPRMMIGVAARIGLPIGANIPGHSTVAPAGFVRVRYALSGSGEGVRVMGELGGGILRNTIKLEDPMGGDTDIVAQGPLLVGAGIGYTKRIGNGWVVFADVDMIAGIAVVGEVGSAIHLNTGISGDMSMGVAVGF